MMFAIYLIGCIFTAGFMVGIDESLPVTILGALIWPISLLTYAGVAVGHWYAGCVQ